MTLLTGAWLLTTSPATIEAQQLRNLEPALVNIPSPLRGMASSVVKRSFFYCSGYMLTVTDSAMTLVCDILPPWTATFGGGPTTVETQQGPVQLSATRVGETIRVHIEASEGTRDSVFALAGEQLKVNVTMASPKLASPVSWDLQYRRGP